MHRGLYGKVVPPPSLKTWLEGVLNMQVKGPEAPEWDFALLGGSGGLSK